MFIAYYTLCVATLWLGHLELKETRQSPIGNKEKEEKLIYHYFGSVALLMFIFGTINLISYLR